MLLHPLSDEARQYLEEQFLILLDSARHIAANRVRTCQSIPDPHLIDELALNAVWKFCERYKTLPKETLTQPWPYIATIICNDLKNYLRKAVRTNTHQASEYAEQIVDKSMCDSENMEQAEEMKRTALQLREQIDKLPPESRDLLLLCLEAKSTAEIAEALQIPPGTVKSRKHHAIIQLKKKMDPNL